MGELPADMAHFKDVTGGNNDSEKTSVIMGRKTAESFRGQKPLANRENILITRMSGYALDGFKIAHSLPEAYEMARHETYIIGGGEIYAEALSSADRVVATEIKTETENGDVFFPRLPRDEWRVDSFEDHSSDARNKYYYSFITFIRRNPGVLGVKE